jgi:membrane protein
MKGVFISISWLYYNFAVFLLGTELIATLRKKDVLLLKDLFGGKPLQEAQLAKLERHFGKEFSQGDVVFRAGDQGEEMYYIVSGDVSIRQGASVLRQAGAGEYFGEMAVFTRSVRVADAIVDSEHALLLAVSADHVEALLQEDPSMARIFLHDTATRLRQAGSTVPTQP